jgi:MFS family permease
MTISSSEEQPFEYDDTRVIAPAQNLTQAELPLSNGQAADSHADGAVAVSEASDLTVNMPAQTPAFTAPKTSIFKNRYFMSLWIAQVLSQTAQNTLNLSLVEYVARLSRNSPTQTAIETVAFVLPGVLFSAIAGVFVDRFNKRTMLFATNALRALLMPGLVFMDESWGAIIPIIFLITFLFSTISQFFAPAESSMIPLLVPEGQFTKANGLFQLTYFASTFVGFSILAPLLPSLIGPKNLFVAMSILYIICTVLVWLLPKNIETIEKRPTTDAKRLLTNIWSELTEGMTFIWREKRVWLAIVYLTTVQAVLFMLASVGIPYVGSKGLGLPESAIIFILAPLSIGLGIGVVLINRFVNVKNRDRYMLWAAVALAANLAMIGMVKVIAEAWVAIFSPGVPIGGPALILAVIFFSLTFGFELAVLQIPSLTILQERSPKAILGRVYAAYFTFTNLATIPPIIGVGTLADLIGLVPVFLLMGVAVLGIGYYAYRLQPHIN